MQEEFYRIKRLPPYVFAEVNALKAQARAAGRDVIDLGMGNPDGATPDHIVKKLIETVQNPRAHGYSASRGIAGLRRAQAAYYARRFGVELDPEREVIVTLGSKEGLANLAQAITAPGDVVLAPNPTYPIHSFGFIIAGASVRDVPIGPGIDFMSELKKACRSSVPEAARAGDQLPGQSDGPDRRSRFLCRARRFLPPQQYLSSVRSRLCRDLFRRQSAAFGVAGAGRQGHRGRVHLAQQDLFDGGLADRLRGRQRAADRRAGAGQILSRLRRLHADPGRGDRRAQWPAGLHRSRSASATGRAATFWSKGCTRPAGISRRRPPRCSPGRRCRPPSRKWAASRSRSSCSSTRMSRFRPAWASANTAKIMSGSRSSRIRQRLRQATRNIKQFLGGRSLASNGPIRAPRKQQVAEAPGK